jgi:hypothetical protein
MTDPTQFPASPRPLNNTVSRRAGLISTTVGLLLCLLGSVPQTIGMNNSVAIGFVQLGVLTLGLLLICIGGSLALSSLWPSYWRSIAADIGLRVAWSGWVLAAVAAMADVLGLGTRPLSSAFIFFGFWQARGVLLGEAMIFIGFLLMIPFQREFPPPPSEGEPEDQTSDSQPLVLLED